MTQLACHRSRTCKKLVIKKKKQNKQTIERQWPSADTWWREGSGTGHGGGGPRDGHSFYF